MAMNWQSVKQVYFLGIGGIGMSAIARYFLASGKKVAGYDKTSTPLTDALQREGVQISFEDHIDAIPQAFKAGNAVDDTLVVLTPAVPAQHTGLNYFREHNYTVLKRSQVLGLITEGQTTYGVAGTHGKTTTSSILAHILSVAGRNVSAFLGGISVNLNSNLLNGRPDQADHEIVVEADEFDRSFLTLYPAAAIITSMDPDHLDIYGSMEEMHKNYRLFASQVDASGLLIVKSGLDIGSTSAKQIRYSLTDGDADYRGVNVVVHDGRYVFDLITPGYTIEGLTLGLPGRHNVENAVAAAALALETGTDIASLQLGLSSYKGVQRRFEYHIQSAETVYIDDYAHHPEELRAAILSARELFPGKKITGIFQPHLYSRTRDFADGFAEVLSLLDRCYLLAIYPAREEPIPGVDAAIIYNRMTVQERFLISRDELFAEIRAQKPEVLLTLGAGDIDQLVLPIKKMLQEI
jgi:UDP-N-acetylmuramate--alanine ligase